MSKGFVESQAGGATDVSWVEAKDAAKYPKTHKLALHCKAPPGPQCLQLQL